MNEVEFTLRLMSTFAAVVIIGFLASIMLDRPKVGIVGIIGTLGFIGCGVVVVWLL